MVDEKLVWIVVPVYERVNHIFNLIECLEDQTYTNYKLIIIDHGKNKIKSDFGSKIEVITASPKLWWTGAINKGIKYILENENMSSDSPILTLNDDVTFGRNYLSNLISDWGNDVNVIMGSVCVEPKSSKIIYANIVLNKFKATFEFKYKSEDINNIKEQILPSDVLAGRGTLIPVKVFMDIGLYNERYLPHYRADYDLIFRAKKKGYNIYTSTNAIVYSVLDSPHILDRNNKLKSLYLLLFGRKSVCNLKDFFYSSFLSFSLLYGTYYFCVNILRHTLFTIEKIFKKEK
jgi:GT2 family glycosyltransferase